MSELSFYSIGSFLSWMTGTTFPNPPSAVYLALFNGDPDQNGVEVTSQVTTSGRPSINFGPIVHHEITNQSQIDFGNAANAATVSWLAVFDAASAGNCLTKRVLEAPVAVAVGDDVNVAIADLTVRLTKLQDKITVTPHVPTTKVIFLTTTGAGTWTVPSGAGGGSGSTNAFTGSNVTPGGAGGLYGGGGAGGAACNTHPALGGNGAQGINVITYTS
jgi:hypothetical protein